MKNKHLLMLPILSGLSYSSNAQEANSTATQSTTMEMAEVVSASFFDPGNGGGSSTVEMPINGTESMIDGIESPEIEVKLQCTADFDITVAASATNFSYSGPSNINNVMAVEDVLSIMITENNTGGTIGSGLSQFQPIEGMQGKLAINTGLRGVRTFKFKYKAEPGFNYAAGSYTTDIVYTLTKK